MRNIGARVPSFDVYQTCRTSIPVVSNATRGASQTERSPVFRSTLYVTLGCVNDVTVRYAASLPAPRIDAAERSGTASSPAGVPSRAKVRIRLDTLCR